MITGPSLAPGQELAHVHCILVRGAWTARFAHSVRLPSLGSFEVVPEIGSGETPCWLCLFEARSCQDTGRVGDWGLAPMGCGVSALHLSGAWGVLCVCVVSSLGCVGRAGEGGGCSESDPARGLRLAAAFLPPPQPRGTLE